MSEPRELPPGEALTIVVGVLTFGLVIAAGVYGAVVSNRTPPADRALCESRGGVYLTAPVEPGCYRVEEVSDGS